MWKNRRWAGVTRTSPWLFEGGPENSLARGTMTFSSTQLSNSIFGTEEQNEDDEPGASIVPTSFWMGRRTYRAFGRAPQTEQRASHS
jgi:hypothetical protein